MKSEIVIAIYKPHQGKERDLEVLAKNHLPTLRNLGLVTERPGILAKSQDGAILEIFEWKSKEAVQVAHEHPEVAKVWEAMGQVCDFGTMRELSEADQSFAHFSPI